MKHLAVFFALLFIIPLPSAANDAPIEVTADEALEWDRANFTFTARGNAMITQGESNITAPQIIAKYSDTDDGMVVHSVTASPNAILKQPGETLTAQSIIAKFDNAVLQTINANNDVILTTNKGEVIKGTNAVYNAQKRIITITDNVTIEQGKNILSGHQAIFDLNTNKSQMTSNPNVKNGRVKAVFFGKKGE